MCLPDFKEFQNISEQSPLIGYRSWIQPINSEELKSQNSSYSEIDIEYIEESENVQAASAHDYYYVPTFYVDGVKIHEGVPTLEKLEEVLKKAL